MKLVIGNKNYSSWSLRPWLLLRQAGIPFEEEQIRFGNPDWRKRFEGTLAPGKVPVLFDENRIIWDSLAIAEYLAERFPEHHLWPEDIEARARARSLCAEMHSSFVALRSAWPFNATASLKGYGWSIAVQKDLERIVTLWGEARSHFGQGGPFLFGHFTIADAYYAPIVLRFRTYGASLPEQAMHYCETLMALPALREWLDAAAQEQDFHIPGEPYRLPPKTH